MDRKVRLGLVVVDAQRAFTDPECILGRLKGPADFERIVATVDALAEFTTHHVGPKVWVRAHYEPGQFTDGDLHAPLARLCSDLGGRDCEWEPRLVPPTDAVVVTKTEPDAGSSPSFVHATEAMVAEIDALLITGFWLTTCVAATAVSCADRLGSRLPILVALSLAATRVSLYDPDDDHPSEVDVSLVLERLRSAGVVVCDDPPNQVMAAEGP